MADVQQLLTRIKLVGVAEFKKGLEEVDAEAKKVGKDLAKVGKDDAAAVADATRRFAEARRSLVDSASLGLGIAGGALTMALTVPAIKAAVHMDSLQKSMAVLMGSARAAAEEIRNIQSAAAGSPALGFESAVRGSITLQAIGMSAKESRRLLLGLANASALSGGGLENLDRALIQLTQTLGSGKLQGDELRIIAEQIPIFRKVLKEEFGTPIGEEIMKQVGGDIWKMVGRLSNALERQPKAAMTAAASVQKLSDAWYQLMAELGKSVLPATVRVLEELLKYVRDLRTTFGTNGALGVLLAGPFLLMAAGMLKATVAVADLITKLKELKLTASVLSLLGTGGKGAAATGAGAAAGAAAGGATTGAAAGAAGGLAARLPWLAKAGAVAGGLVPYASIAALIAGTFTGFYKAFVEPDKIKAETGQWAGDSAEMRAVKLMQTLRRSHSAAKAMLPNSITGGKGGDTTSNPYMAQTAMNTAEIAANTGRLVDYRRYALGGGELGALGVSPVEMGMGRRDVRSIQVQMSGGRNFEAMMTDMIQQTVHQMRRQGLA